jgi:hypothetical protein
MVFVMATLAGLAAGMRIIVTELAKDFAKGHINFGQRARTRLVVCVLRAGSMTTDAVRRSLVGDKAMR